MADHAKADSAFGFGANFSRERLVSLTRGIYSLNIDAFRERSSTLAETGQTTEHDARLECCAVLSHPQDANLVYFWCQRVFLHSSRRQGVML